MKNALSLILFLVSIQFALSQNITVKNGIMEEQNRYVRNVSNTQRKVFAPEQIVTVSKDDNTFYTLLRDVEKGGQVLSLIVKETSKDFKISKNHVIRVQSQDEFNDYVGILDAGANIILLYTCKEGKGHNENLRGWLISKKDLSVVKSDVLLNSFSVKKKSNSYHFADASLSGQYFYAVSYIFESPVSDVQLETVSFSALLEKNFSRTIPYPDKKGRFFYNNSCITNNGKLYIFSSSSETRFKFKSIITEVSPDGYKMHQPLPGVIGKIETFEDNSVYMCGFYRDNENLFSNGIMIYDVTNEEGVQLQKFSFTKEFIATIEKLDNQASVKYNGLEYPFDIVKIIKRNNNDIEAIAVYTLFGDVYSANTNGMFNYHTFGDIIDFRFAGEKINAVRIPRNFRIYDGEPLRDDYKQTFYDVFVKGNETTIIYADCPGNLIRNPEKDKTVTQNSQTLQFAAAVVGEGGLLKRKALLPFNVDKMLYLREGMFNRISESEIVLTPYRIALDKDVFYKIVYLKVN